MPCKNREGPINSAESPILIQDNSIMQPRTTDQLVANVHCIVIAIDVL